MAKQIITTYLHSDKESMRYKGEESRLSGEALDAFAYALYEVKFVLEVDADTGGYKILSVDGKTLAQ